MGKGTDMDMIMVLRDMLVMVLINSDASVGTHMSMSMVLSGMVLSIGPMYSHALRGQIVDTWSCSESPTEGVN